MGKAKSKNPRITKKERNLIKGGIRRVFSRSELRKKILEKSIIKEYGDPNRKRVTRWSKCDNCGKMEPTYLMQIDHKEPVVPINTSFDDMSIDDLVDNQWCDEDNLKPLCKPCHEIKTKAENKERRRLKKERNEKA